MEYFPDYLFPVGNEYGPSTALNTFLRDQRISVGTKHMCFQGGCGACLVEVKLYEPITQQKMSYAVNSVSNIKKYEPRHEKINILHMRQQKRISARNNCAFVFAYAKIQFSHDAAHLSVYRSVSHHEIKHSDR